MVEPEKVHVDYEDRLAAVTAALAAAESQHRFGEAHALRLAQSVLRGLIEEEQRVVAHRPPVGHH